MKEVEKLDLILRTLYNSSQYRGDLDDILASISTGSSSDEVYRLGHRLEEAGYVKFQPTKGRSSIELKSEGVEFVEGNSFTKKGESIVNNHYNNIVGSTNVNVVTGSHGLTIHQTNINEAKQLLTKIKEVVTQDDSISEAKRQEVIDCVKEVESGIDNGTKPKFAIKALLDISSKIASIASLALELYKTLNH